MNNNRVENNLVIENARIGFKNFSGKEAKFNQAGRRNFCVFFEYEQGKELEAAGWNIKWLKPRDEGDMPSAYMQVAVSFDNFPPKVILIDHGKQTTLDASTIDMLDWAELQSVDIVIRPYNWEVQDKHGVKAYLKTMYATLYNDILADKYKPKEDASSDEEMPF